VEELTGIDFFWGLEDEIEKKIEKELTICGKQILLN
jgi:hypothetical protein